MGRRRGRTAESLAEVAEVLRCWSSRADVTAAAPGEPERKGPQAGGGDDWSLEAGNTDMALLHWSEGLHHVPSSI